MAMQALIRIKASELDMNFVEKIKTLFKDEVLEIGINTERLSKEENYSNELNQAIENVERNENLVAFTGGEFEQLAQKLAGL